MGSTRPDCLKNTRLRVSVLSSDDAVRVNCIELHSLSYSILCKQIFAMGRQIVLGCVGMALLVN